MQVVRTPCKTELIAINKLIVIQCLTQIRLALIPTTFKRPVFRYSLSEFCLHSQVDRSDTQKYANWFALRWLVPHGAARVSHSAFYICILDVRKKIIYSHSKTATMLIGACILILCVVAIVWVLTVPKPAKCAEQSQNDLRFTKASSVTSLWVYGLSPYGYQKKFYIRLILK